MTDFFFFNMKLYWPYDLYKYSEDIALSYLVSKNYDVELALALVIVNLDDLVDMMRSLDDLLERNLMNYDSNTGGLHHAHFSVRHRQNSQEKLDNE